METFRFFGANLNFDFETILIIVCSGCIALIVLIFVMYLCLRAYKGHNRFLCFLRFKIFRIKSKVKYDAYYSVKPRYLSPNEHEYFTVLKNILKDKYLIFPQVPLSQIVEKHSASNYKTDLFRVIDFCIFDKSYYPLLCVEINDTSHLKKDRSKRDQKVGDILKSARIPLLTLWTYEGIDEQAIKKQLKQFKII